MSNYTNIKRLTVSNHLDDKSLIEILKPPHQKLAIVISSPHSGRSYSNEFLSSSQLNAIKIRTSEDPYVDEIYRGAVNIGIPTINALYPRAFVDPNRAASELDPNMFFGKVSNYKPSPRVTAGYGVIPRCVASGVEIYSKEIPAIEATRRIETYYKPYHSNLALLIEETKSRFGKCLLLDCHSMPSKSTDSRENKNIGHKDIVLGDRFGKSCAPWITESSSLFFTKLGLSVSVNNPYAGAHITTHYGNPSKNVHALQIEINRNLYMNETNFTPTTGLAKISGIMQRFLEKIGEVIN